MSSLKSPKNNCLTMTSAKEYEDEIGVLLDVYFSSQELAQVRVRKSLRYGSEKKYKSYSPNIDVSVGPFSERRGISLWNEYDRLVEYSCELIDQMIKEFKDNYEDFGEGVFQVEERNLPTSYTDFISTNSESVNWNARCFMAIEVEDSGSRKHLLGDMVNVSISGRVGVVIGYNEDRYKGFLRQLDYLAYTVEAKKIKFNSKNIIVLKPEQFRATLIENIRFPEHDF